MYYYILLALFIVLVARKIFLRNKTLVPPINADRSPQEIYTSLRNMAFSVGPELFNLMPSVARVTVYGVIMEWQTDSATITMVCNSNGDASLYFSSGGGFIGGGQHENVNSAAKAFVTMASAYLEKAVRTEDSDLVESKDVAFNLQTTNGIYRHNEPMENVLGGGSDWTALFFKGNEVITEYRLVAGKS